MALKIYHNPRCTKSRETLALINENGADVEVVEYLKDVLTEAELKELLSMLGLKAEQLVRRTEAIYKENYRNQEMTEDAWVKAMVEHPKLIQRPIVVSNGRAVIGRPPELVLDLINNQEK